MIEWSYHLLDASEQRLFRRISVFVGGCMLEGVEAVCAALDGEAAGVVDGVFSLLDKSLLQRTEQEGQESRLVMLETIREYALETLDTSREMEDTRQAHAAYYLQLVEEAKPELVGPQQTEWLERLEREHDNLRAALSWWLVQAGGEGDRSSHEMALALSTAVWQFWEVRGHYSEGRTFLERVLVVSEGSVTTYRLKALKAAASMAVYEGDTERGEVHPWSLEAMASMMAVQGEPTWAAQLWGAAEALRERLGTPMPPVDRADYERSW
jgi:predicted ATPase